MGSPSQHYLLRYPHYQRSNENQHRLVGIGEPFITGIWNNNCYGMSPVEFVLSEIKTLNAQWKDDATWGIDAGELMYCNFNPQKQTMIFMMSIFSFYPDTKKHVYVHPINGDEHTQDAILDPTRANAEDGISLVDYRDPHNPKYCFAFLPGRDGRKKFEVLDARQYMEKYYPPAPGADWKLPRSENEDQVVKRYRTAYIGRVSATIKRLSTAMSQFQLLTESDLNAVWPATVARFQPRRRQRQSA